MASGSPSKTLSRIDSENRVASSNAMAMCFLSSERVISLMSTPSISIKPEVTSWSLVVRAVRVLFPQPVIPISATDCPGSSTKLKPEIRSGLPSAVSGYRKWTSLNSSRPLGFSMVFGFVGSVIRSGSSITSKKRVVAVLASSDIESKKPRDSVGQRSTIAVAKNATSAPTLNSP